MYPFFCIRPAQTFIVCLSLLFALSCTEKMAPIISPTVDETSLVTVSEAKAYFEANLNLSDPNARIANNRKPVRIPLWNAVKEMRKDKSDNSNVLIVPVLQDRRNFGLFGVRNMLVYKDKKNGNKLTYAMIEAIADNRAFFHCLTLFYV